MKNTAHRAVSQLPFPSRFCLLGEKCGPFRSGQLFADWLIRTRALLSRTLCCPFFLQQ